MLIAGAVLGVSGQAANAAVSHPARPEVTTGAEIPSLRGEFSRTYKRSDGSKLAKISADPINFKDASGAWKPIDNSLKDVGDSLANTANALGMRVPDNADESAKVSSDGRWVSFSMQDAAPVAASVKGATATYEDARPGVDLAYTAESGQLKEALTLADAEAISTFRYSLTASSGLSPHLTDEGAIEMRDASGARRFTIAAPWMADADGTVSHAVGYKVAETDGGWTVTLTADHNWLQAPGRKFPVVIDPTTYPGSTVDCEIASGSLANTSMCDAPLRIGKDATGIHRALLKFDVSDLTARGDVVVQSARLGMWFAAQDNTTSTSFDLMEATQAWGAGATWNSTGTSSAWSTAGGSFAATRESRLPIESSYVNGWISPGMTRLAQGWIDGNVPNRGLVIKAGDETVSTVKTLNQGGPTAPTNGNVPNVEIIYRNRVGSDSRFTHDTQSLSHTTKVSVDLSGGNVAVSQTDLKVAGRGVNTVVSRTFNSREGTGEQGMFGQGWYEDQGGWGVETNWWDDGKQMFGPGGQTYAFQKNPDGTYRSPTGFDGKMTIAADGSSSVTMNRTGEKWGFDSWASFNYPDKFYDRNGNYQKYYFNNPGCALQKIVDSRGRTTTATCTSAVGGVQTLTDPAGRVTNYAYDTNGRLTSVTNADSKTTSYTYDANERMNQITTPGGRVTKIAYTGTEGVVASITRVVDGTTANDVKTSYAWTSTPDAACQGAKNAAGQPVAALRMATVTDPLGHVTRYCLDQEGKSIRVLDALGRQQDASYTPNGDNDVFTSLTGTASSVSKTTYDLAGTDPTNNATQLLAGAGEKTTLDYYAASGSDPLARYRVKSVTSPNGSTTAYGYDGVGRTTSVKDSATSVVNQATMTYNTDGGVATSTDGNGNQSSYSYNTAGELTTITPAGGIAPTTLTYDSLSRVSTSTQAGTTTTMTYDLMDRVTKVALSDGTWTSYGYDADGNQTSRNNQAAQASTYTYDKLNRRTNETFPGSVSNGYTYTKSSQLKTLTDGSGTTTYGYDDIDRVTSIQQPGALTSTVAYNESTSPLTQTITYPNGVKQTTSTDQSGKPVSIIAKNAAGATLQSQTLTYISGTTEGTLVRTSTDASGVKKTYSYGPIDNLTGAVTSNSGGTQTQAISLTYDKALNRETRTITGTGAGTTTYAYNAANQLCWTKAAAVATPTCGTVPTGATSYAYDTRGNRTTETGGPTLAYNPANQLTSIGSGSLSYLSPNNGELTSNAGSALTNNVLGLGRIGVGATATNLIRTADGGGLASEKIGTSNYWPISDNLGSVTALTDSTGAVVKSYNYDIDGNSTAAGTGPDSAIRYAGGYAASTGLYHFGARYYQPSIGRWTQADPAMSAGNPATNNRYVYAGANSCNAVDPSGLVQVSPGVHPGVLDICKGVQQGYGFGAPMYIDQDVATGRNYPNATSYYVRYGPRGEGGMDYSPDGVKYQAGTCHVIITNGTDNAVHGPHPHVGGNQPQMAS